MQSEYEVPSSFLIQKQSQIYEIIINARRKRFR